MTAPVTFLCCVNRPDVARSCLLASPCLAPGTGHQLLIVQGMRSAGEGFALALQLARHPWIVMVHQDVFLPAGWDGQFDAGVSAALRTFPRVAVAGVYGVRADGEHVGLVYDRDRWLGRAPAQPQPVRSLDELLLAVRRDRGLRVEPDLGWHLYGTDLCLQAEATGQDAVVIAAACEHRSTLPRSMPAAGQPASSALRAQIAAFNGSSRRLASKWPSAMPVVTAVTVIDHGRALSESGG